MAERVKIGTKTLSDPVDLRQGYETAAWYKIIHCEPQTVDVFAELKDGQVVDTSIGWTFSGTVTDSSFPSLLGGVAVSDGQRPGDLGKEEQFHVNPYAHAIARSLLQHGATEDGLELDVAPLYVPFRDHKGDGLYTTGLFVDPDEEQSAQSNGVAAALNKLPIPHESAPATFGWAMATQAQARRQIEDATRSAGMADYALRTYAPEFILKPELDGIEH